MKKIRNEKLLSSITKKIEESGVQTEEEINAVLQELMNNQNNEDFEDEDYIRTPEEESQDLVYDAQDAETYEEAKRLINKALKLDPNNIDAILFVAEQEKNDSKAIAIYQKAVAAGRKKLGEEFFEENRGHFWGILETRPFMRAMLQLGGAYHAKKMFEKTTAIYNEMLELCPNDNLGVRYLFVTTLLEIDAIEELEEYYAKMEDEEAEEDNVNYNYSKALFQFKKEGATSKSNKLLLKAFKQNNFVTSYLTREKQIEIPLPDMITYGGEDEAMVYVVYNFRAWEITPGSLDWIKNLSEQRKSIN